MKSRRSPRERQVADLKRFFLRNRWAVRGATALAVTGAITLVIALGLPRAIVHVGDGIRSWAGRTAGLTIKTITIAGLDNLPADDVKSALAVRSGDGLYDINVAAARGRLLETPWVADATILRVPPDRLHVTIKERIPAILWQHDNHFFAADAEGSVIARVNPAPYAGLFHVVGDGASEAAPQLIEALTQSPGIEQRVRSCVFVGNRRWDLHFDNHVVIEMPDRGLPQALDVLSRMITEEDVLDHDVAVVDLRNPDAPRLRLNNREAVRAKLPGQNT